MFARSAWIPSAKATKLATRTGATRARTKTAGLMMIRPVQLEALVSRKRAYTEALLDPPDLVVSRKRLAHAT